jgi:hypothetical protein
MGASNTPHGDSPELHMAVRDLVDIAIDEDPRAPCLWVPTEYWEAFCQAVDQTPNVIGAIIYRNKTIREGPPYSDITTLRPS